MKLIQPLALAVCLALASAFTVGHNQANAATAEDLNQDSLQALKKLTSQNVAARALSTKARATLVFPNVVKAGLVFGGAYGEGVMMKNGRVVDYYNTVAGSWGLQAGAQSFGYVVFLMNDRNTSYSIHYTKLYDF